MVMISILFVMVDLFQLHRMGEVTFPKNLNNVFCFFMGILQLLNFEPWLT